MVRTKLSKEEKQLLKDFEAGEFKSVLTPQRKKMLQAAAKHIESGQHKKDFTLLKPTPKQQRRDTLTFMLF